MRKDGLKTVMPTKQNFSVKVLGMGSERSGTTKGQRKIGAVAINDMVVAVNELPDGTSSSAVDDISRELKVLRETARALAMPNADSINWPLLVSSTSDSASTQKNLTSSLKNPGIMIMNFLDQPVQLKENFCAMHLGINLRKALLSGTDDAISGNRQYFPVDTFVNEFC